MAVSVQEMERMVQAIVAGEPKPALDVERSDVWDRLAADVASIKRRGGKVELAFDVPFLDESEEAKILAGAAPAIEHRTPAKDAQQPRAPRKGWF